MGKFTEGFHSCIRHNNQELFVDFSAIKPEKKGDLFTTFLVSAGNCSGRIHYIKGEWVCDDEKLSQWQHQIIDIIIAWFQ